MAREDPQAFPTLRVPDPNGLVNTPRDDSPAIRAQDHGGHGVLMPREDRQAPGHGIVSFLQMESLDQLDQLDSVVVLQLSLTLLMDRPCRGVIPGKICKESLLS